MTERTIDFDAMKSELTASGLDVYTDEYDRLYVSSEGVFGYLKLPHPESPWSDDYWKAVGIIAKHVAPTAGAPAVDVDVDDPLCVNPECRHPRSFHTPDRDGDYCCVGHGTMCECYEFIGNSNGIHTKLIEIFKANTSTYTAGNATCSDFEATAAANAVLQLLGYPAVEPPVQEVTTPVEEGEMPW